MTIQRYSAIFAALSFASALLAQSTPDQYLLPGEAAAIEAAWAKAPRLTNSGVTVKRGFGANAATEALTSDVQGIARTNTRFWERIEVHLPRSVAADHMVCLMVNNKCQGLPVGASVDKKNSILYWHIPNAYRGDFDFVFLQPGGVPGVVRVTAGMGN